MRFARVKVFPGPPLLSRRPCLPLVCRLVSQFPVVVFYNINLHIRVSYQGILWRTYLTTFTTVLDSTFKTRKLTVFLQISQSRPTVHMCTHLVPIPSTKTNKLKEMGEEISTGFNLCINRYIYRVYCLNRMFTQLFR